MLHVRENNQKDIQTRGGLEADSTAVAWWRFDRRIT